MVCRFCGSGVLTFLPRGWGCWHRCCKQHAAISSRKPWDRVVPHFEWNGIKCLSLIDRGRVPAWFLAVAVNLPSVTEWNSGRGFQPHLGRAESSLHPAGPSRWPYKSSPCLRCLKHGARHAEVRLLPPCPNITPRTWRSAEKSRRESSSA